jgi:formyl-CoA transferase
MDRQDPVVDSRFETGLLRAVNGEALTAEVGVWTRERDKHEVMRQLGEAGVPCSAIFDTRDLYHDPHLLERGFAKTVEHPERGTSALLVFAARMTASEVPFECAPQLAEHSGEVLRADLDADDKALRALHEEGVLGGVSPG